MDDRARLDEAKFGAWVCLAHTALTERRDDIDGLNVYPVPDADTGSNLLGTWTAVREAVEAAAPHQRGAAPRSLARVAAEAALRAARGNSGTIVAQLLASLAGRLPDASPVDATALARVLSAAATETRKAVATPAPGTILSVLEQAAAAASSAATMTELASAMVATAARALAATTTENPVLARAGVVDAGGLGVLLILQALGVALAGEATLAELPELAGLSQLPGSTKPPGSGPAEGRPEAEPPLTTHTAESLSSAAFEVTYRVDAGEQAAAALRSRLQPLGDSLVIAGSEPAFCVHLHTADLAATAAAIQAGIDTGAVRQLTLTSLAATPAPTRAFVAVAGGAGAAVLLEDAGAYVVGNDSLTVAGLARAIDASGSSEVLVLPADEASATAAAAAIAVQPPFRRAVLLPVSNVLHSLIALSVSEPTRELDSDVAAITEAVNACRVATVEQPEAAAVLAEVDRLLAGGGELLTVLLGNRVPDGLVELLAERYPELELEVRDMAPDTPAVILGLE